MPSGRLGGMFKPLWFGLEHGVWLNHGIVSCAWTQNMFKVPDLEHATQKEMMPALRIVDRCRPRHYFTMTVSISSSLFSSSGRVWMGPLSVLKSMAPTSTIRTRRLFCVW